MLKNFLIDAKERLDWASKESKETVITALKTTRKGLHPDRVEMNRKEFGDNQIDTGKEVSMFRRLVDAFINPFTSILIALAIVSYFTDIYGLPKNEREYMTVVIITTMVVVSGLLQFIQETRSGNAAKRLSEMVQTTTLVIRRNQEPTEIPIEDVVVGDIIQLSAGDMIPADMLVLEAKDLFVTQSALTGESYHVEKTSKIIDESSTLTDRSNLIFMGSDVISGYSQALVLSTGNDTLFGEISEQVQEEPDATTFEKGVNSVSWLLIRFMAVMVPIVFVINGVGKNDWLSALLFSVSIAVGLTPEMLPMIVTTSLAKGAVAMSKEKTIVKSLNSIQDLGSMDILCTDKTGTLTQDKVVLEYHLDVMGNEDDRILRHAFLNSYYQTGLKNLMDKSIIEKTMEIAESNENFDNLFNAYIKVDEVPFDFNRRRMSVVVADSRNKTQMITKGAVEEMLSVCSFVEYNHEVMELTEELSAKILETVHGLNERGMRVIAVAQKTNPRPVGEFSVADEKDMVLMGYLSFLDPPKESAMQAIDELARYGVQTKVMTGDNDVVTKSICDMIGIDTSNIVLGSDLDGKTDEELKDLVQSSNVFAKLAPLQKQKLVSVLREMGHTVGFLGDGINDAPAMTEADIGISVDTAVDIAKESSEVILLEKDLNVLVKGIIEGRKTYANMIKYIKMTASSNFGNVFSVLVASAFLPFLPMEAMHLVLLNLIYDLSSMVIPWDNVDEDYLEVPRKWDAESIRNFMIVLGPTSSVFDITTYFLMFFLIAPQVTGMQYAQITDPQTKALFIAVFQAGWFVESMWSQTLVIHMLRTPKIPFIESSASALVTITTFAGILLLTAIPFTGFGQSIGLARLPLNYFGWLAVTILGYMLLVTVAKRFFMKRYGELL
ncbi:magnesium-translocating P-type ATPase [Erysipelothrix urinaevulpis]|uniref:magnesium-translocating P-type ATPase n=1 Tax=Erysipelothrix urinaevulpis TaxID=2683717 RepID=UPI001357E6A9|nr:magnesium-translocating P-type ATPase [Erysipelothrix urinaevulpis]